MQISFEYIKNTKVMHIEKIEEVDIDLGLLKDNEKAYQKAIGTYNRYRK